MIDIEKIKQRRIAEALQKRRDKKIAPKTHKEIELNHYTERVKTCIEQKKNCPTLRQTWET